MASHGVPRQSSRPVENIEQKRQQIQEYRDLDHSVRKKIVERCYTPETLQEISELLKRNPEYYSVWNYRRVIRQAEFSQDTASDQSVAAIIKSDLEFLFPLLRSFPKCYWIWNYRLWILDEAKRLLPKSVAYEFWQKELALVGKMLSMDSRNFHGWGYRRFVVAALEDFTAHDSNAETMTQSEVDYTKKMIGANLSNFSAWHNRTKVIYKLLDEQKASDQERKKVLDEELNFAHKALIDPYDQSLWFYHQSLMCVFDPSLAARTMAPNLTSAERLEYVQAEKEEIKDMLEECTDCKWIYQALIQCNLIAAKIEGAFSEVDRAEVIGWLGVLVQLDPLRKGHWADIEKTLRE
ncbi:hypothetical protein BGW36DRAFT_379252 [Talaromyces proteolyticus]|uniref:Geranylgeranyl transferase type-2 subunit alpha n=1 Tax=Talaromyces proteolyticus TaxID=1131652 RepID=A0AAD4KVB0_9EURO|nr:uncharacterized protein BGW36DRAFT_379252 [Talaromyces proteolyticus]KAH8697690.1 hypothetical protein BGW36DRAFT_379252 [Talaromyces proteolyticus]